MQMSSVALVWTQKTGAPMRRSRKGPAADPCHNCEEEEGDERLLLLRR